MVISKRNQMNLKLTTSHKMMKVNMNNFIAFNRMKNSLMLNLSPSIRNTFLDVKRNSKQLKKVQKKLKNRQVRNHKNNLISLTIFSMAIMMVIIVRNRQSRLQKRNRRKLRQANNGLKPKRSLRKRRVNFL